jgi:hypothetical protein
MENAVKQHQQKMQQMKQGPEQSPPPTSGELP